MALCSTKRGVMYMYMYILYCTLHGIEDLDIGLRENRD
jgi:hypothetical protein